MYNPYENTQEPPDEEILPHQDEINYQAMKHALDMVYASLEADGAMFDSDWERERDHYAEDLRLEERYYRHPARKGAA